MLPKHIRVWIQFFQLSCNTEARFNTSHYSAKEQILSKTHPVRKIQFSQG